MPLWKVSWQENNLRAEMLESQLGYKQKEPGTVPRVLFYD